MHGDELSGKLVGFTVLISYKIVYNGRWFEVYAFVDLRIVDASQCLCYYKTLHHDSWKEEN